MEHADGLQVGHAQRVRTQCAAPAGEAHRLVPEDLRTDEDLGDFDVLPPIAHQFHATACRLLCSRPRDARPRVLPPHLRTTVGNGPAHPDFWRDSAH